MRVMQIGRAAGALLALGGAIGARAQTAASTDPQTPALRTFCSNRPGLNTPPCTVDPGHVTVELGGLDWTRESDPDSRTDTLVGGDLLVRLGLTDSLEAKIGWTPYGHVRMRDRQSGTVTHDSGTGDISVALQQNLSHPDGSGFSIAVTPYATLPAGGQALGAGDWGAGVLVPISYGITDKINLTATPEIDAAVDEDRTGRHLAYGSAIGLTYALTGKLGSAIEFQATRDRDPEERSTQALASVSLGYQPQDGMQFDVGAVKGLNRASPDIELYFGVSRRF